MSFAKLLVSDSQTMTIEAAVLGVPSVRYNSFVGRTPVIEEIENRYHLTYGFLPAQQTAMLEKVVEILSEQDQRIWRDRRNRLLQEKSDFTSWIVDFIEKIGRNDVHSSGR
jgi:predicted glycosyltransferase